MISGSHGQLFLPHWGSSAWHSRRVNERGKSPCIKDPLLYCASTPLSDSSTQHVWELLAGNRGYGMLMSPNKRLFMAATAQVIWLFACVRYWPGRGLVYVPPLL